MQMTVVAGAIFALACFGVALQGFLSLGEIEPALLSDARGFAIFWAFLGTVCGVLAGLAWWITRGASAPPH
ncbi:MAG TPA: hypothetical protein VI321_10745 [Burkholderiales bacterium]